MEHLKLPKTLSSCLLYIETKANSEGYFDNAVITKDKVDEVMWLRRLGCISKISSTEKPHITNLGFRTLVHIKYENEIKATDFNRFSITTIISILAIILSFSSLMVSILKS